jgi:hypothetical protein
MFRRAIVFLTLSTAAIYAQSTSQDAVSKGILNLLASKRITLKASAQIHRLGEPDGVSHPVSFDISLGSASALIDETNADGSHTRSIAFKGQRTYEDGRSDIFNSSYLLLPQFDLADELADPKLAIDSGQSGPGLVSIRVHTSPASVVDLPGEVDKTYVIDTVLHQIVAVKSSVRIGTSNYTQELRYGTYQQPTGVNLLVPTTVTEVFNGEQLWQLSNLSIQ